MYVSLWMPLTKCNYKEIKRLGCQPSSPKAPDKPFMLYPVLSSCLFNLALIELMEFLIYKHFLRLLAITLLGSITIFHIHNIPGFESWFLFHKSWLVDCVLYACRTHRIISCCWLHSSRIGNPCLLLLTSHLP